MIIYFLLMVLSSLFIKGSAAPVLLWHTKGDSSEFSYHPDQTDSAQFISRSWQYQNSDPVALGLMKRDTRSRAFDTESSQLCFSKAGHTPYIRDVPSFSPLWAGQMVHHPQRPGSSSRQSWNSSSCVSTGELGCSLLPHDQSENHRIVLLEETFQITKASH